MRIDIISDLHGYEPKLEGGDLLIVAGDLTACDRGLQHLKFIQWFCEQKYEKKVLILGNHDGYVKNNVPVEDRRGFSYLLDSGTEYKGLKIWGSPWTPTFYNWHFMKDRGDAIKEKWDLIPEDTDILITHGPPFGILDEVKISSKAFKEKHAGCEDLRRAVERIQPRLHAFGHIHEGYGQTVLKCATKDIICVNASIMNENYDPVNKPIRIIL